MKLVMTLVQLDREVWWVDFKELLGVLGTVIAAVSLTIATFTYRRNTDVRAQDVKANKIKRTHELMISYPGDVREKVLLVTKQLQEGAALIDEMQRRGVSEARLNQMTTELSNETDLVELMHLLDPYGYLLSHQDYLFVDDAISTFASEVERVLLNPSVKQSLIDILDTSSMFGITHLQKLLQVSRLKRMEENR